MDEFRDMVKALHRAIEVILDVVFNHTAEGNEGGPTLCFRGLDNNAYYILESKTARALPTIPDRNTLTSIIRSFAASSWTVCAIGCKMHVDGFRFDSRRS